MQPNATIAATGKPQNAVTHTIATDPTIPTASADAAPLPSAVNSAGPIRNDALL
jgi:hypothetical protein